MKNHNDMRRVALISGGSRGIGRAIALMLAEAGYDIALLYAGNTAAAEETAALAMELGACVQCYQCDVSDFGAVASVVKRVHDELGPIWALINNAGVNRDMLAVQMRAEDFTRVVDVNLTGAFHLIRHTYAGFLRRRGGRIVNITSVAGITGNAGQANYAAAKAGLIGLTKSIAKELAPRGITCNAVAPGLIETDMARAMQPEARDALVRAVPMKRAGLDTEVAGLVKYLASDEADYITGAVIPVDGGLSM